MTVPIATGDKPGYHLTLSDGVNTVGFLGAEGVANLRRLPRGPGVERKSVAQRTWTGGRGNRLLRDDARRFFDSSRMWTTVEGQAMQGPLARYGEGLRVDRTWMGFGSAAQYQWHSLYAGGTTYERQYFAASFSVPENCTIARVQIFARKVGTPGGALRIRICANTASLPGATLAFGFIWGANITDWLTISTPIQLDAPEALVAGTTYWIVAFDDGGPYKESHYEVAGGFYTSVGNYNTSGARSDDGVTWTSQGTTARAIFHRIADNTLNLVHSGHFYEYKRALYFVQQHDDGVTVPKLFMNGDRGVATSGGASTLTDTTKAWPGTYKWQDAFVLLIGGPGADQWAKIVSNTATQLTISGTWLVSPAANTEYVIVGTKYWQEITGHGLTGPVTDVAVMNNIVYFGQGLIALRRMQETNVAGVWTRAYATDSVNALALVATHLDDGGVIRLFGVNKNTSQWAKADQQAWGVNLTFTAAKPVGDNNSKCTGIEVYDNSVWISKEDAIGKIELDKWKPVPIEMAPGRDPENGQVVQGWNTNLYFNFLDGLERLYGHVVDDIGPNRGLGMPVSRRGTCSVFLPVMQYGYAAVDIGRAASLQDTMFSSVLMTTSPGGDWHEIHQAFVAGRRIRALAYQALPDGNNFLWVFEGPDMVYLAMSRDTTNPRNDALSTVHFESYLTTSYFDLGTPDLDHFFDELRAFTENLNYQGNGSRIEVDYRKDDQTAWTRTSQFSSSPHQVMSIQAGAVTGRQIQFRLRWYPAAMQGNLMALWQLELRANQMNEVLYDYSFDVRLEDKLTLLNGNDATGTALAVIAILESWQEVATPLTMRSVIGAFDNKRVHLDPVSLVPRTWSPGETKLAGGISLKET